jgi:hypothetical protein
MELSQAEADSLIQLEKHRADEERYMFPPPSGRLSIPLVSPDGRELFSLDLWRSQLVLNKGTYQNRARTNTILVRIDFGGAPHRNPDGAEIGCPHLHVFREGYGDKWAIQLPPGAFANIEDPWVILIDFMHYVNITVPPHFDRGLFS